MKSPAGKRLKAADIAVITGLSEERVRDISRKHSNRIPSQKVGRIQVYDEKAAGIFMAIAHEEKKDRTSTPQDNTERVQPSVKMDKMEINNPLSRLSAISKNRDEEEKVVKATASGKGPSPSGRVPTQLINTVAMQGQQFSRFADRLTAIEDAANGDRKAFKKQIELLEHQVAGLQEQMEAVDSWIHYVDQRLDAEEAQTKKLAKETHTWTEYVRGELAFLRLSWWKRRQLK